MANSVLIKGLTKEKNIEPFQIDDITKALVGIDINHSAIHDGNGFIVFTDFLNVLDSGTHYYCAFKTPTVASKKIVHLAFSQIVLSQAILFSTLYEAPTATPTGGTPHTIIRRNRSMSSPISAMQAFLHNPTVNLAGAIMIDRKYSSVINYSTLPLELEMILKPDTWYVRDIFNNTGQTLDISITDFWYEEDSE